MTEFLQKIVGEKFANFHTAMCDKYISKNSVKLHAAHCKLFSRNFSVISKFHAFLHWGKLSSKHFMKMFFFYLKEKWLYLRLLQMNLPLPNKTLYNEFNSKKFYLAFLETKVV